MKEVFGFLKKEKAFLNEAGNDEIISSYEIERFWLSGTFVLSELIPMLINASSIFIKGESLHMFIVRILDGRLLFYVYTIMVSNFLKMSKIFFDKKNKVGYKIWLSMLIGMIAQFAFGTFVSIYNYRINMILNGILTFIILVASYILDRKSFFVIFCLSHGMEV